jgi:2-C-methyl-D-erythritol 4-phosphate cytidylyltransferase
VRVLAVLTAAGSGTRLGHALPKALVPLHEEPLVAHAARRLLAACPGSVRLVSVLVVTAPAVHVDAVRAAVEPVVPADVRFLVVPGGPTRQASVAAALAHLGDDDATVLVHDAARPWAPPELVERVAAAVAAGHDAVVPGLPVTDTVKRVGPADAAHAEPVLETVERGALRAVQTPQGFRLGLLRRAHDEAARHAHDERVAASDDAGLVERLGLPVWVVPGDERAAKITTARDLRVAELLGEDG